MPVFDGIRTLARAPGILARMPKPIPVLLLAGWLMLPALAGAQAEIEPAPGYRLGQLATRIANGPAPLQVDLARIALTELSEVYTQEADRAQQDSRHRSAAKNLYGWVAGVRRLAQDYATLANSVTEDTPIQLSIGPDHNLHLFVAGQLVVISTPRMNEQTAFEQRIVAQFCQLNRCEGLVEEPARFVAAERSSPAARWEFGDRTGPSCKNGAGLAFQFANMINLADKRAACDSAMDELHRLAMAIARETASGIRVDWGAVAIYNRPEPDQQKVVLNGNGDVVQLSLPFLAEHTQLFNLVRPWLSANIQGEHYSLVVINAGWLLASPGHTLD
jgi:hypothetical protein